MKIFYGTKKLCLRKTKLFLRRMQKRHSSLIVCAACGGIFGRVSVLADKLLITKQGDRLITAWTEDGRICRLQAEPLEGDGILGNIYVGKVRNIVKNINAAFVEDGLSAAAGFVLPHCYGQRGAWAGPCADRG